MEQRRGWWMVAVMVAAFVLRSPGFGNAALDLDEQWYLLVGDRLLAGAVPYLDLWDRKPVGLFLLYGAIRMLPGDGIVAYQVSATIFAGATAIVIATIARRLGASLPGMTAAAILYLLVIGVLGGQGGQSPVFYNLPVALAAAITMRLPELIERRLGTAIGWNGIVSCGLVGAAMQFKYTAAVEGVFVGLAHVWAGLRSTGGGSRIATAGVAVLWWVAWASAGLLPTLAVAAVYAARGATDLDAFLFANFVSITLRHGYPFQQVAGNLASIGGQLLPLVTAAAFTVHRFPASEDAQPVRSLAVAWLVAAAIGFIAIGTFHDHYALPLAPPLAALSAVALARSRLLMVVVLALATSVFVGERLAESNADRPVREAARLVRMRAGSGCPYVFMGDPIIYHLAHACIPTARAFPNTLAQSIEQGSSGVDEAAEVTRIMAGSPPVVISSDRRRTRWNDASAAVMGRALARDYRLERRIARGGWNLLVYVRRIGPERDRKR